MNGTDTFLDINNAHLRVNSGNVQASAFILDQIDFIASSNASTTVGFNNATTAFLAASNIEVGTANLFVDTTTSNVGIGTNAPLDTLHVKGGTLIDGDLTVNGTISAPSTSLQGVTDTGNITSNTVQFSNAITSLTATSNIEVAGFVGSSGTGALTVPNGTTGDRPAAATGMIRYNSTTGFMEGYAAAGWAPIAQPPTVTGISPLTTVLDGNASRTLAHQYNIVTPDGGGGFGSSVAMSTDGTYAIVGAVGDDTGANNSGAAHIFIKNGTTWTHQQKLLHPYPSANDYMGISVAISGDGTYAIVGVYYDDTGQNEAGSAQVFWRNGTSWYHVDEILHPSIANNDQFGYSVGISGDGTYLVVGSYNDDHSGVTDAGSVQVYRKTSANGINSQWNHEQSLNSASAFVPTATDWFGHAVSISLDGNYILCGAKFREGSTGDREGRALVFVRNSGNTYFSFQQLLTHPTPQLYDEFAWSVSLSSDGTYALIGVPGDGSGGSGWSTSASGGTAQVFVRNGTTWTHQAELVHPSPGAAGVTKAFGYSVSISGDGVYALIGVYEADVNGVSRAGSAQIFKRVGTSWTHQAQVIRPTPGVNNDAFTELAMSSDGAYAIAKAGGATGSQSVEIFYNAPAPDTSTQVFTATGTGIVSGSTVQLEGADGSLYSVSNVTPTGTQVTFKMGSEAVEFPPSAMSTNTSITGYTASASYNSSTAWKAFDDIVSHPNQWTVAPGNDTVGYSTASPGLPGLQAPITQDISGTTHRGHWLQLQIPSPVILTRAVIGSTQAAYQHGKFVILGSNDNLNWTVLHAGTGTTLSTNVTTLSAGSTEAFSYFRVVIKSKAITGQHTIELNNVQFFGRSGSWDLAQQPYKVKVNSTSGLTGTSTAKIGFPPTWTTAVNANLEFDISANTTHTLEGTDGGGGTNRKFTIVSTIPVSSPPALPSGLTPIESTGVITGQIGAVGTTSVTFRLTDNNSGFFTDRAINIVGTNHLYPMTFPFTFTNAGKTGGYGPTLSELRTAYTPTWTDYTSNLNMTIQGVQEWTVPSTGSYEIDVYGARGRGANATVDTGYYGKGARMKGRFSLTKGQILKIVVGQEGYLGPNDVSNYGGTGGGGTFVYTGTTPLIIAGGGGGGSITNSTGTSGTGNLLSETIGRDGQITTAGTLFNYDSTNSTKSGTYGSWYVADNGASGGNWTTSSSTGYVLNGVSSGYSIGGGRGWTRAMATNFYVLSTAGHASAFSGADGVYTGGFGGGNGAGGNHCGGGGGGYSGGASTNYSVQTNLARSGGGGGGSYNSGTNQSNSAGVRDGHGQVIINRL